MPPRHAAFPTRCTRLSTQAPAQTRPAGSDMRPPSLLERSSLRKPRYRLLRHIITSRSVIINLYEGFANDYLTVTSMDRSFGQFVFCGQMCKI